MITISNKCESCRWYWNVTCNAVKMLYTAKNDVDYMAATKQIEECIDGQASCQPPQEREPMGQ